MDPVLYDLDRHMESEAYYEALSKAEIWERARCKCGRYFSQHVGYMEPFDWEQVRLVEKCPECRR